MRPVEEKISSFIHSPSTLALLAVFSIVAAFVSYVNTPLPWFTFYKGLGFPSPDRWFSHSGYSFLISVIANGGLALLMVYVNDRFNLLRDVTRLYAGLFLLIQTSVPMFLDQFYGGTLLALLMLVAMVVLYDIFNHPGLTQAVFLIFVLIAMASLTEYGFIAYIPILFMGCAQMRVVTGRTLMAALMALVAPIWICWAFGWIDFSPFPWPDFTPVSSVLTPQQATQTYAAVIFSVAVGVILCVINLVKVFSYNSRSRAYNGFVALLLFATALFMLIDFTNFTFYVTLFNACVAFQIAQFFVINRQRRSYIVVITLILCYLSLFIWWMSI